MSKWPGILGGLAALSGAAGVAEAAAAAHRVSDPLLKTSADFLIVNAAAVIALAAFATQAARKSWILAGATALFVGGLSFCAELSVHALLGQRPAPLAAPIGGALMILGWLIAAVASLAGSFESRNP